MYKSFNEKTKDFFINMGKKHRLLLPLAIVGLAITMLLTRFFSYCKRGTKRFASLAFIVCMFFIGNSFAYPIFNIETGFVSEEQSDEKIVADDSDISLIEHSDENSQDILIPDSDLMEDSSTEYGEISEDETYSLEDILNARKAMEEQAEAVIEEPEYMGEFDAEDWRLILVNKQHPIPDDYTFTLGTLSGSMQCDERIIDDLLSMMKSAAEDGIKLVICSPYRDLAKQEKLFARKINLYMNRGYSYIDAYKLSSQAVTVPGASEHQIGLAVDIITGSYTTLDEGFADTNAGKWLKAHCAEYGFTLRYPKNKEYITSIEYEPWHFRYVGREAASIMMSEEICLEEFWELYV